MFLHASIFLLAPRSGSNPKLFLLSSVALWRTLLQKYGFSSRVLQVRVFFFFSLSVFMLILEGFVPLSFSVARTHSRLVLAGPLRRPGRRKPLCSTTFGCVSFGRPATCSVLLNMGHCSKDGPSNSWLSGHCVVLYLPLSFWVESYVWKCGFNVTLLQICFKP